MSISTCPLPEASLLARYRDQGAYTDCYTTTVNGQRVLADYVTTFYTTPVFKLERLILRLAVQRPSTDRQAMQLGRGEISRFAAWTVEARREHELLLCDYAGRTRSWLMIEPRPERTRLYFGSAVVPLQNRRDGKPVMGAGFHVLLGFHRLYSRALLLAAAQQLRGHKPR